MTNHLAGSTSPYLLQHADNPVDWHPWGPEALEKARRQDRPIFLSIGYAACHWCHVMAHESFEDIDTAAIMNSHFINIKVDREQRPDLDNIYMAAVVALTGQGGWPMSVFLTPSLQPFHGGTYFPREGRHGLPAFRDVLWVIARAWKERREEIMQLSGEITAHLAAQAKMGSGGGKFNPEILDAAAKTLIEQYDWNDGGWGSAPKFPQPMAIDFLLRRHQAGTAGVLEPGLHALRAMRRGGMYDVVGGGFARYSTDPHWRVPHFEKMLYDNAQLALAYLHGWQVSGEDTLREVVEETLGFTARELLAEEGGFYSSLDADSEGKEGSFYTWTQEELRAALGDDAGFFESAYQVTQEGNWEGRIVLHRAMDDAGLASQFGTSPEQVRGKLGECHARLLARRNRRIRPGTDDKILTAWNGLMLAAFAEAGRTLKNEGYLKIARRNVDFLLTSLRPEGRLRRSWYRGQAGEDVFLEDYAALILGLLSLYQSDFNNRWFIEAVALAEDMIERFSDETGGFFDTPADGEPLPIRPKDIQDNATPSGNALAVEALLKLAALSNQGEWHQRAEKALGLIRDQAVKYPAAFGRWLGAADLACAKITQVAVVGSLQDQETMGLLGEILRSYRPNLLVAAGQPPPLPGAPALLNDRPMMGGKPTAYVCVGFLCKQPVNEVQELSKLLGDLG